VGTDLTTNTNPGDTDVVANHPADERAWRTNVKTIIETEHYSGSANNDRHKMVVGADDTAVEAAITSPLSGNFALMKGNAAAANAPPMRGISFHDGTDWFHNYFVPTGTILQCAFNPATPPDGFLNCNGAAVAQATYADLYAVIGTAFNTQDGVGAPGGSDFRVPLLAGHTVMGLSAGATGQAGWVRNVSGQNDLFISGTYTDTQRRIYIVEITGAGTPDTFRWNDDAGKVASWTSGVFVGATNALSNGITLNWGSTTGHSVGDIWTFVVDPLMDTVGAALGVDAWQLDVEEMPGHNHGGATGSTAFDNALSGIATYDGGVPGAAVASTGLVNPHTHTIASEGGTDAHENAPHAVVLGHIIKT
jgi:microcystin-dependent protein